MSVTYIKNAFYQYPMVNFTLEKCKTKATYSAKLVGNGKIDLDVVRENLDVVLDTPVLVVVKVDGIEVVVHGYGELLFKQCEDTELMEKVSEKVYSISVR